MTHDVLLTPGAHRAAGRAADDVVGAMMRVEGAWMRAPAEGGAATADQVDAVAAAASSWPRNLVALAVAAEDAGNPVVPLVDEVLARRRHARLPMAEPMLAATRLAGTAAERVLLVVGPSLGTAVGTLWGPCAAQLAGFEVVGWDLPGHGLTRPAAEGFTVKDLAASVRPWPTRPRSAGRRATQVYPLVVRWRSSSVWPLAGSGPSLPWRLRHASARRPRGQSGPNSSAGPVRRLWWPVPLSGGSPPVFWSAAATPPGGCCKPCLIPTTSPTRWPARH